jgi:hypothetical protein
MGTLPDRLEERGYCRQEDRRHGQAARTLADTTLHAGIVLMTDPKSAFDV